MDNCIDPRDSGFPEALAVKPVTVMVAAWSTAWLRIDFHVSASGFHVCAAACSGVNFGSLLLAEMHRSSISPILSPSPFEDTRSTGEPSAKATVISQRWASFAESRHWNVGGIISGGKIDPFNG